MFDSYFQARFEIPFVIVVLFIPFLLSIFQYVCRTKIDKLVFTLVIYFLPGNLFITHFMGSTFIFVKDIYALFFFILLYFLFKNEKINLDSNYLKIIKLLFVTLLISTFIPFFSDAILSLSAHEVFSAMRRSLSAINFLAIGYFTIKVGFNKEFFDKLAKLFLVFGIIIIVDGYLGHILGLWKEYATDGYQNRLTTFLGYSNDNTVRYLTLGIVSAYYIYWKRKNGSFLVYVLTSLPIYIFAVTRAGYILFALTISIILISNSKKLLQYIHIILLLIPIFIFAYSFTYTQFIEKRNVSPFATNTLENRFRRWDAVYNFISTKPDFVLTGAGFDNWHYMMRHEYKTSGIPNIIYEQTFHNQFLEFIIENGILGAVFVFIYFITSFGLIIKGMLKKREIIFASTFSIIVIAMVMNISWTHQGIFIIALYLLHCSHRF